MAHGDAFLHISRLAYCVEVDLHGLTLRARIRALIDLAAPSMRDELTLAARQRHWL